MAVDALLLVLAAAGLHALWNVLVAGAVDVEGTTATALVVGVVAFAPIAVATWRVTAAAIPFMVASAAFELVYFALLVRAYERDDVSVVYPLTRGMAPVLVLAVSATALGLDTTAGEVVGVVVVACGVLLVRGSRSRGGPGTFLLALAIAGAIAGYTLVDRWGVRHANPLAYLELVLALPALAYALHVGGRRVRSSLTTRSVSAGLASFGAYTLVLLALRLASPASVAAVRESSIVIAVALAAAVLQEPVGRRRYAGAGLVAAGVATIALT